MDALRALRKQRATVIVLRGHGDAGLAIRALQIAAERFLAKPIDTTHLLTAAEKNARDVPPSCWAA